MASSLICQSLFSTHRSSSPSPIRSNALPLPSNASVKQFASAIAFGKPGKPFVLNCTSSGAASSEMPIELKYPAFPTAMDINQIREILPHRFPFLLVDRVIEYVPEVTAVAIKNVTINDNFFPGHFPEKPTMPGVLMLEAMAQVGALVALQPEVGEPRVNFLFGGVDKIRFRRLVIPGDTLVMRMNMVKLQRRFGIARMEGKAYVGGEVACEGRGRVLVCYEE